MKIGLNCGGVWVLAMMGMGWLTCLPLHAAEPSAEQNWPQWRGPLCTGVAPLADPPIAWSETSNIKWKTRLPGGGTGTPIIWGDRIFIQAAIATGKKVAAAGAASAPNPPAQPGGTRGMARQPAPTEAFQFVLLCLDRSTGKTIWQRVCREEVPHEATHPDHGFASYSPVTDGKLVFAFFGSRGLHCFDMDGNLKWQKDLGKMKIKMAFGEGCSPALFENTLIINWDHEAGSFIVALDKETGKELWRQVREEETSWATPLMVRHEGRTQVITAATRRIRSYDIKSGTLIWECAGMTSNVIPTPVTGEGVVYALSGFRGSALLAIRLGRSGDLTGSDAIAWSSRSNTPYVPSPLLYDGRLYFLAGNNAILSCLQAKSGKPLIDAQRLDDLEGVYASPIGAGGRVYLVGRNGAALVIKCSDKLEVLGSNRLDERFDASPVAVGNELFLRGHEYLYCIVQK